MLVRWEEWMKRCMDHPLETSTMCGSWILQIH